MFKLKTFWIYGLVLLTWAALTLVTTGLVYELVLHQAESDFNKKVERLDESIGLIARDNESILEGFSAFLSAIEYADRGSASRYARQILARYPHVYALEVALIVQRHELAEFVTRQKQTWLPRFKVKQFNYTADRPTWQRAKKKPIYYPIIFLEPLSPVTRQLIGADLDAAPFLRDALTQSRQSQITTASTPFKLIEGPWGYALFHPVPDPPKGDRAKRKQGVVLLEVTAEAIQNKITPLVSDLDFRLYHAKYSSDDPEGLLLHIAAPAPDKLEERLFPRLTIERKLDNPGQPFVLKVEKQLGWFDLDLPLVIATGCTSLLFLAFLLLFLDTYFRREKQRKKSANRLLHMATHDALTGLPNRTLLADRFSQACSRTQRRDITFSMMFLDLDGFKLVNDTHGHEIGDQLLKAVGGTMKECIRNEDTLSRISGDEFVILLEDTSYADAQRIARKIQAKLTRPLFIRGIELSIGLSLGIAVYPDDGVTMSELLRKADARMYEAKERGKGLITEETVKD